MHQRTFSDGRRQYLLARVTVARHYREPLTLTSLARALSISPRQLQRLYVRFGDLTFHEDLVERRMSAAADLLVDQPIPVKDVGRLVGYPHPAHFAVAFRCRYGLSPALFRERARRARDAVG